MDAQFVAVNCHLYGHFSQRVCRSNCVVRIAGEMEEGGKRARGLGEREGERMRGR